MRMIYVVTHPEAQHHVDRVVGGWHDSPLTDAGRLDAMLIAGALRDFIPRAAPVTLHTSDLRRCTAVAQIVGDALDVEMVPDERLREKSYGEAEGRPQAWLDERFTPPPAVGDRMHHHEGIEGSETKHEFARRVGEALADVLLTGSTHSVIVTHGFALTFVVMSWLRIDLNQLGYANLAATPGSITVLKEDDHFHNRQVVRLDGVEHLRQPVVDETF